MPHVDLKESPFYHVEGHYFQYTSMAKESLPIVVSILRKEIVCDLSDNIISFYFTEEGSEYRYLFLNMVLVNMMLLID